MTLSKSYWLYALFIIVLASGFFILFKKVLPNKIFPESVKDSEHIVVDEWMQKAMEEDSLEVAIEEIEKRKTAEEIIQGAISSKEEYVSLNTISENKKR